MGVHELDVVFVRLYSSLVVARVGRVRQKACSTDRSSRRRRASLISAASGTNYRLLLTEISDRLPAISGAARRFAGIWVRPNRPEHRYLAGCWRDEISKDLMWRRLGPDITKASRIAKIPSWSWAGTKTHIGFDSAMFFGLEATLISSPADGEEQGDFGKADLGLGLCISGRVRDAEAVRDTYCHRLKVFLELGEQLVTEMGEFVLDSQDALSGAQIVIRLELAEMQLLGHAKWQQVSLVLKSTSQDSFQRVPSSRDFVRWVYFNKRHLQRYHQCDYRSDRLMAFKSLMCLIGPMSMPR
ncbi:hypothetical protein MKZ38_008320 [Zalerion maritima]|uniref:Uncharacterized protein n=1 Tax=Zalerion maritima TaxID=339359 RepID=A0AAD5RHL7_9PEZI|nr:hypothetical protein MKZ38_008320 [Zalerion maritima]